MRVRCGSCRTEFEVAGAGRYACPVCGSVNVVREAAGQATQEMGGYPSAPGVAGDPTMPPPPPPPPAPMPKIMCPECDFTFVVGLVDKVTCPMCSAEVDTGIETEDLE
jgi:Zn finger protein HypA/HybF involved in hydrogenase expression